MSSSNKDSDKSKKPEKANNTEGSENNQGIRLVNPGDSMPLRKPHHPRDLENPRPPFNSSDYTGPPGGFAIRSESTFSPPPPGYRNEADDQPPTFSAPFMHGNMNRPRFHDDLGPGISGGYESGSNPIQRDRPNDIYYGGNLVGPDQLSQHYGRGGLSGPVPGRPGPDPSSGGVPGTGVGRGQNTMQPRYDPVGPFPGMQKPNADHMRKPGPPGFGPGGML